MGKPARWIGLGALLSEHRITGAPRLLRLGTASPVIEQQLGQLLQKLGSDVLAVEDMNTDLPQAINLAIVTAPTARIPDVFEDLLYGRLLDALNPGAVAVVQFCRDVSDESLNRLKVAQPFVREALQQFSQVNFGDVTISTVDPIQDRFAEDGAYECVGWATRGVRSPERDPFVWLVLRKRAVADPARRAIVRSRRPDRYAIEELVAFFSALKTLGVVFLPAAEFAERARAHYVRENPPPPDPPFGLIKFDIHRDIRRPLDVANALARAGIAALFLMMHRHPFNEGWFDRPETWTILEAIRGQGHEIGLHLDPFHLVREFGDLRTGVERAIADFASRGFAVRSATLHGDTAKPITDRGLNARDFFREDAPLSTWDGTVPPREPLLADHIRRYSYADLAKAGIEILAEARLRVRGEPIWLREFVYLTDNSRTLRLENIPNADGSTRSLAANAPLRIPPEFAKEVFDVVRAHPFLALFHPQWFS